MQCYILYRQTFFSQRQEKKGKSHRGTIPRFYSLLWALFTPTFFQNPTIVYVYLKYTVKGFSALHTTHTINIFILFNFNFGGKIVGNSSNRKCQQIVLLGKFIPIYFTLISLYIVAGFWDTYKLIWWPRFFAEKMTIPWIMCTQRENSQHLICLTKSKDFSHLQSFEMSNEYSLWRTNWTIVKHETIQAQSAMLND